MSMFCKFAYLIGMTPWEDMVNLPLAERLAHPALSTRDGALYGIEALTSF